MDDKPKIELEELLKLKKFEQPGDEFWETFDQGLRKKSMEALVKDRPSIWSSLWDRRWIQQVAVAAAIVFCAVPAYLGIQNYQTERAATEEAAFALNELKEVAAIAERHNERIAETTRELALKKKRADNMRFVADSYTLDPSLYRLDGDAWTLSDANQDSNRTYVNDRVKLLPQEASVLPVNLSY